MIAQCMNREACSLEIVYHAGGSCLEAARDRGKKHLLEHCIVARTKNRDHDQMKDWEFRENIMLNAYTAPVQMAVNASGYKGDFKTMFDTLWEVTLDPTFDESDLAREKQIVLREISERRGDPNYRLYYHVQNQIFTPQSLECHEVLGDSDMVAQTTIEDFKKLHKENLQNSHILICVSGGGIDLDYIESEVKKSYGGLDINYSSLKSIDFAPFSKFQEFSFKPVVHELAHEHADVYMYVPSPVQLQNQAERQIFNSLFMQHGGVLYDKLRDEKQLVYGLYSWAEKDLQTVVINLQAEINRVEEIVNETERVFADFAQSFREDRFVDFKNLIYKKQAVAKDQLGVSVKFTRNNLTGYGVAEDYDSYTDKLRGVQKEQLRQIFDDFANGWQDKKIVVVSKNSQIEKLRI